MAELSLQDSFVMERVVDPSTPEFQHMLGLLMKAQPDGKTTAERLRNKSDWKHVLPFRGSGEEEMVVREKYPFVFSERGEYRNGVVSLAVTAADLLDLVQQSSGKFRTSPSLCVSQEIDTIQQIVRSAGNPSTLMFYTTEDSIIETVLEVQPETMIFDHTTISAPIDEILNMAYRNGIRVVDGVFPYHVAAVRGWDIVFGDAKWSITHSKSSITIGPDDDCTRLMGYKKTDYLKFVDPKLWRGNSRNYGYEIRKNQGGLVTYRAVYLGTSVDIPRENLSFKLPLCSSSDMVLVSINRDLAAGTFSSKSNNAQSIAEVEKNYAIEVRRELFVTCVNYLISKDKGTDIVGEAIRYITQHNYVDLVEGVRIIRCPSMNYADALCVAMVCALTAFSLRYRLTSESIPDIERHRTAAGLARNAPLGALGRLAWLFGTYVGDAVTKIAMRARESASHMLESSEYIPGVCYDVYTTTYYQPDLAWFEPKLLELEEKSYEVREGDDAFTNFLGDNEKTSAPSAVAKYGPDRERFKLSEVPYIHNVIPDPEVSLQHVYDQLVPGNSVGQIQNAAELRRVRDVNINTEFHGKIEINKDIAAPEKLHVDAPVRTAAVPVSNTPLLDAIMASAKRNFNPPDIQQQSDPWAYAKYLVDKFVGWAFVPNFEETLGKTYERDPITFSVFDYLEWKSTRDKNYKSALESECPEDMVELNLEKYDTIVKKRIKPKMNVSAQHELAQPQVIVSMSKKDTALFTSVFRRVFERLDSSLRPEIKSAGRMSDDDISDWLTEFRTMVVTLAAIELDSGKFDKSQGLLARMVEALIMQKLGLDPNVSKIFEDSYVGRVSSKTLGLMFISAYQMKSGGPQTMLGNLIYNMVSAMEAVGPENIRLMLAKGDDNLLWLVRGVDMSTTVNKMSGLFNLEVKSIVDSVLYFSSGYVVDVGERVYFVPDPAKVLELAGERGVSKDTLAERFVSFQDRVRSMTRNVAIPHVLQKLVRARVGVPELDVIMCIDAFASMASDYATFKKVFE